METELSRSESIPRSSAGKTLAWDLFVAYVAAWGVGVLYGAIIRATSTWDDGAVWERNMLRWFHAWTLPSWLDATVLQVPLTGTNLTILPLTLAIGWWLWKRKNRGIIALQLLVVTVGSLSLNPTMKYLLGRDRPDLFPRRGMYNWASYPSGHAILTIAVYITVALSVLAHGLTAAPLADSYARWYERRSPAMESAAAEVTRPRGAEWHHLE